MNSLIKDIYKALAGKNKKKEYRNLVVIFRNNTNGFDIIKKCEPKPGTNIYTIYMKEKIRKMMDKIN